MSLGYNCGEASDGCGGTLSCGTCTAPSTCGGGGRANVCGCTPRRSCGQEGECGTLPDGCGGMVACGTCSAPEVCGGRGQENTCAIPATQRVCSPGGWCWEYPVPHGHSISGAHFRAPDDGWAVGEDGFIQHWNGTQWTPVASGTSNNLRDVHAVSATDIWAVGQAGTALRSTNGTTFSSVTTLTVVDLHSVWASGASDVWTVGKAGTVLRNRGTGFTAVNASTTEDLNGVWGSGPSDVWVVGNDATIRHHNGTSFASVPPADGGTSLPLYEVTGTSPTDVWTVTSDDPCLFCNDYGVVYRLSTTGAVQMLRSDDQLFHVFAAGPSSAFTVGEGSRYRWDGTSWPSAGGGYNGVVAGSGPTDVWLLGSYGLTERWDGTKWVVQTQRRYLDVTEDVYGVGNNVWVAEGEDGRVRHWNGGGWRELPSFSSFLKATGLYATSPTSLWVVTSTDFGSGSTSDNRIYRWNGTAYTQELPSNVQPFTAVHGSSDTDIWAVGPSGEAVHRDATGWTRQPTGAGATLNDVWVSSPSLAIAVGDSGTIQRWNGTAWASMTSGTSVSLKSVWGVSPTDVWAVGANGTMLRYNGTAWRSVTSGTTVTLNAIWGVSASEVWAAGEGGTLLRFNGTTWTAERTGTRRSLTGVWAASASDVWVTGTGAILHKP